MVNEGSTKSFCWGVLHAATISATYNDWSQPTVLETLLEALFLRLPAQSVFSGKGRGSWNKLLLPVKNVANARRFWSRRLLDVLGTYTLLSVAVYLGDSTSCEVPWPRIGLWPCTLEYWMRDCKKMTEMTKENSNFECNSKEEWTKKSNTKKWEQSQMTFPSS